MPDCKSHKDRYEHNKLFLSEIREDEYSDWAITVCFYSSLHKVCQYLKYVHNVSDIETKNHVSTLDCLKTYSPLLYQNYYILYNLSRTARYECVDVTKSVPQAKSLLKQIESTANSLISQYALSCAGI